MSIKELKEWLLYKIATAETDMRIPSLKTIAFIQRAAFLEVLTKLS